MSGICALCLSHQVLQNSHVIPEFMYEWLYDDKHRFHMYRLEPEVRRRLEQKGLREKLLCRDCEGQLAKYEGYAALLLRGDINVAGEVLGNLVVVSHVDYRMLRLFLLSVLWRSSVSNLDFFSHVKLGPHQEKLRTMLKDEETSPPWRYGCLIAAPLLQGQLQQQPTAARSQDGIKVYCFLLVGCHGFFSFPTISIAIASRQHPSRSKANFGFSKLICAIFGSSMHP